MVSSHHRFIVFLKPYTCRSGLTMLEALRNNCAPDPRGGSQSHRSELERLEMGPIRASRVAISGVPAKTVTISSPILEVAHSERLETLNSAYLNLRDQIDEIVALAARPRTTCSEKKRCGKDLRP
jgi:hypothetical protein